MIKRALLFCCILNSIILIGIPAGHGYGVWSMIEIASLPTLWNSGFELHNEYPFGGSHLVAAFISLIGKLLSIGLLFSKNIIEKKSWILIGQIAILLPFLFIVYETWVYDQFLFTMTFGSGILYLLYMGRVFYLIREENRKPTSHLD